MDEESLSRWSLKELFLAISVCCFLFGIWKYYWPADPRELEGYDPTRIIGSKHAVETIKNAERVSISKLWIDSGQPFPGQRVEDYVVAEGPIDLDSELAGILLTKLEQIADQSPKLKLLVGSRRFDCRVDIGDSTSTIEVYVDIRIPMFEVYERGYEVGDLYDRMRRLDGKPIEGGAEFFEAVRKACLDHFGIQADRTAL